MKTLINIAAAALLILTACTSANQLSSVYDDDGVYTSKKDKAIAETKPADVQQNTTKQAPNTYTEAAPKSYNATEPVVDKSKQSYDKYKQSQAENANAVVENNNPPPTESNAIQEDNQNYTSYDPDDYYDYGYSSRIRRFHNPCRSFSYYDDYYTNMYWYNHDPFYYGTSIYMGYNPWGPSYTFYSPYYSNNWGWSIGFGFGWGIGMLYSDWYNPYWGWGGYYGYGGYGGYGHGYGYGYGHGYGHDDDYWASNHNNSSSHFYGPRNFASSSNGTIHRATSTSTGVGGKSSGDIQPVVAPVSGSRGINSNVQSNIVISDQKNPVSSTDSRQTEPANINSRTSGNSGINTAQDKPANNVSGNDIRRTDAVNSKSENPAAGQRNYSMPSNQNARINNYQRYSRSNQELKQDVPADNSVNSKNTYNYREAKSYNSPNYTQPRSSQEFEAPKYKSERNYNNRPTQSQPSTIQETPRQNNNYNNRGYSTPAPNYDNRNYTPPARSEERNYTPPPSRNENKTYTAPSNNSYSSPAPSRSNYTPAPSSSPSNSGSRSGGNSGGSEGQRRR